MLGIFVYMHLQSALTTVFQNGLEIIHHTCLKVFRKLLLPSYIHSTPRNEATPDVSPVNNAMWLDVSDTRADL